MFYRIEVYNHYSEKFEGFFDGNARGWLNPYESYEVQEQRIVNELKRKSMSCIFMNYMMHNISDLWDVPKLRMHSYLTEYGLSYGRGSIEGFIQSLEKWNCTFRVIKMPEHVCRVVKDDRNQVLLVDHVYGGKDFREESAIIEYGGYGHDKIMFESYS